MQRQNTLSCVFLLGLSLAAPLLSQSAVLRAQEPASAAEDRPRRVLPKAKGDISFDDIKFDIEKGGEFDRKLLTKEIEALNKKTVRIRGYIYPTFQQSGIKEFVLVRDNMECCFGPGAAIYDCIRVEMEKGRTADYTTRPVSVKGKFEIEELRLPDGLLLAIYKLTAVEVK
ncbi:DUF3299 domain-containing protein [Aureliella helgolandensis]|uniref:DUF3299 domain-containing protein n=1 Tax=Aureliella helgolandensis TaxID=2527968 RepID=A0A518GFZ8_9BACT|nr:DUF3299 domain-containing protein [Aureliella helgolandensis]QDV27519.1 hypothetical protein Q31a_59080 [Aureliella helgolandensis]